MIFVLTFNSFNKKEADFTTLQEYNDYLEEVEQISKYQNDMICVLI